MAENSPFVSRGEKAYSKKPVKGKPLQSSSAPILRRKSTQGNMTTSTPLHKSCFEMDKLRGEYKDDEMLKNILQTFSMEKDTKPIEYFSNELLKISKRHKYITTDNIFEIIVNIITHGPATDKKNKLEKIKGFLDKYIDKYSLLHDFDLQYNEIPKETVITKDQHTFKTNFNTFKENYDNEFKQLYDYKNVFKCEDNDVDISNELVEDFKKFIVYIYKLKREFNGLLISSIPFMKGNYLTADEDSQEKLLIVYKNIESGKPALKMSVNWKEYIDMRVSANYIGGNFENMDPYVSGRDNRIKYLTTHLTDVDKNPPRTNNENEKTILDKIKKANENITTHFKTDLTSYRAMFVIIFELFVRPKIEINNLVKFAAAAKVIEEIKPDVTVLNTNLDELVKFTAASKLIEAIKPGTVKSREAIFQKWGDEFERDKLKNILSLSAALKLVDSLNPPASVEVDTSVDEVVKAAATLKLIDSINPPAPEPATETEPVDTNVDEVVKAAASLKLIDELNPPTPVEEPVEEPVVEPDTNVDEVVKAAASLKLIDEINPPTVVAEPVDTNVEEVVKSAASLKLIDEINPPTPVEEPVDTNVDEVVKAAASLKLIDSINPPESAPVEVNTNADEVVKAAASLKLIDELNQPAPVEVDSNVDELVKANASFKLIDEVNTSAAVTETDTNADELVKAAASLKFIDELNLPVTPSGPVDASLDEIVKFAAILKLIETSKSDSTEPTVSSGLNGRVIMTTSGYKENVLDKDIKPNPLIEVIVA